MISDQDHQDPSHRGARGVLRRAHRQAARDFLLCCTLLLLALPACSSTGYVAEQAWHQLRVMNGRQRIATVLRRRDLTSDWREKLQLVLQARRYAAEAIGLPRTASYTRFYDTGGRPLAHNLSACPKDRLAPRVWRFPIVGALPYLGFFDEARAKEARRALEAEGLDTQLRPVPAFSSLGWFADPVYSPMLEEDVSRLIEVVIHETTHTTIFVRGEVAFNESLAVFVGDQGTLNFLARVYGPLSPEVARYQGQMARRRVFGKLVAELYQRLERLYRGPLSRAEKLRQREETFRWAQERYKELFPDPAHWTRFARAPLNNAILLSYGRYNQGLEFHYRAYAALGRRLDRLVALYRHALHFRDPMGTIARLCRIPPFATQRM